MCIGYFFYVFMQQKIHCHIVGLGLGVWEYNDKDPLQRKAYVKTAFDVLNENSFENIASIDFSWIGTGKSYGLPEKGQVKNIEYEFSDKSHNPAQKRHDGRLVVAMYAWDGNSFPGNEYWGNYLQASGDPAAACCSTIIEAQNIYINKFLSIAE